MLVFDTDERGLSQFLWQDARKMGLSPSARRLTQKAGQARMSVAWAFRLTRLSKKGVFLAPYSIGEWR